MNQINKIIEMLGRFAGNPYFQMFIALVLIVSSINETVSSFTADVSTLSLRLSHGTLLLGVAHLMRTLPDVVDGFERAAEAKTAAGAVSKKDVAQIETDHRTP